MTVWTDNADTFASRDRVGAANLTLEVAVQQAVELLKAGEPGHAEFVLEKAHLSAQRILGPAANDVAARCDNRISGNLLGLQCVIQGPHDGCVFESTSGVRDRHFLTSGGEG